MNDVFEPMSGLLMRTCARRMILPVSPATILPASRPVPVLAFRPGGSIIGISPGLICICPPCEGTAVRSAKSRAQTMEWLRMGAIMRPK